MKHGKNIKKYRWKWENVMDNRKIGIIDSGVGGLTTAKEFGVLLPDENIIYAGDNKNVPYGNRSEEEIYLLTKKMIDFLIEKDVKIVAVACNTISSLIDKYFLDYEIPIVSIIKPAVQYVYENKIKNVGVIATDFTINSKVYNKYLHEKDKDINVVTEGCPSLAAIIDKGDYSEEEVQSVIDNHMKNILKKGKIEDIILGCTHYPIELERFKKVGKDINYINPAHEQTLYIKQLMEDNDTASNTKESTFEVYTTGNKSTYLKMLDVLGMKNPDEIYEIEKF